MRELLRGRRSVIDWPARLLLAAVTITANITGLLGTAVFVVWALPKGPLDNPSRVLVLNLPLLAGYLVLALPLGMVWIGLWFRARIDDPERERQLVLYGPLRVSLVLAVIWGLAAALFGLVNARFSIRLGVGIAETLVVGGITTCALCYLLAERILRRATSRVLAGSPPRAGPKPTVLLRPVLFWMLGTAVPVSGLLVAGLAALSYGDVPANQLTLLILLACGVTLLVGFLTTVGAARAVADPVRAVRQALQRVEQGDLDVSVPVYDRSELGQLQAGFNNMVAGLRERDRIRDLFSRQVGDDVARATASAAEVRLGGEIRLVAVLFVDLVGSTALAAERPPTEVVELLNRFFGVVVEVVEHCGGWINKFEGDAALAVFGAPNDIDNPAGRALTAARTLAERLSAEVLDVFAGIGVSAGEAVAGYLGDVRRYEYTVIGDPVNEAARLTELAKAMPGRVLATAGTVALAQPDEASRWRLGEKVTLRGRATPTRLATPAHAPDMPPGTPTTVWSPNGAGTTTAPESTAPAGPWDSDQAPSTVT